MLTMNNGALCVVLVIACCGVSLLAEDLPEKTTVYGCLFSPKLCHQLEFCFDDNLFGTCESLFDYQPKYKFSSTENLEKILEFTLEGLLKLGYSWADTYTQCIVSGLLKSYRLSVTPQLSYCDENERIRLEKLERQSKFSEPAYKGNQQDVGEASFNKENTSGFDRFLTSLTNDELQFLRNNIIGELDTSKSDSKAVKTAADAADHEKATTTLSDTDQLLLEQLTKNLITVDDLSKGQIKQLRNYLQNMIDKARSKATTTGVEETTPSSGERVHDIEKSGADSDVIENILRRFSAERMKQGEDNNMNRARGLEDKNQDFLGQQISNQLKHMELLDTAASNQYDAADKESKVDQKSKKAEEGEISLGSDETPLGSNSPNASHTAAISSKLVDSSYVWLKLNNKVDGNMAHRIVEYITGRLAIPSSYIVFIRQNGDEIMFQLGDQAPYNGTELAEKIWGDIKNGIYTEFGVNVRSSGIGHGEAEVQVDPPRNTSTPANQTTAIVIITVIIVLVAVLVILFTWSYMYKRQKFAIHKFEKLSSHMRGESTQDSYEDLCRQRMHSTSSDEKNSLSSRDQVPPLKNRSDLASMSGERSRSPRSSTSSWSEEPVSLNMDISTGHTVLAYMEDHLSNTERLSEEWNALCAYTPDTCDVECGKGSASKNRYPGILPYDYNRVKLENVGENEGSDYINASFITDHDPRVPGYIATQGLLRSTVADFWQMVWQQECTTIVMLTSLAEENTTKCHQYWPSEGRQTYGRFEVYLVSEHIWCEAFLVRSFYLKNMETNSTRTVTQFHFLSWLELSLPDDCKDLLDFRRDGSGRTGTYILLDMVINRIHKGVKEVDIAATLEHIRDQRMKSVATKEQFEFVLSAVAEEVQALLKSAPQ